MRAVPRLFLALCLGASAALWAQGPSAAASESASALAPAEPEAASGVAQKKLLVARHFLAVTANPLASEAARGVLARGGNALDAALAAQWVLNLVEPQSSGIGGGAFLLYWDARLRRLFAWDGRETAPRRADPDFARHADGSMARFEEVVATGKSVGTPGLVAMLAAAHRQHGKQPWAASFAPALRLAEQGFAVSERLHALLAEDRFLPRNPDAAAMYYHPDGSALGVGETLRNPAFAATLRALAADGPAAFYRGPLAAAMSAAVQQRGGWLDEDDLAAYAPRQRAAVCGGYRSYRVCGMPPPSSGGITVLQLLALLELSGPPLEKPESVDAVHRFSEAGRLAYADRARYLGDADFVGVPQAALLDPAYLARRAALIQPGRSLGHAAPGVVDPPQARADDAAREIPATTHLSIVDAEGNAVAMTSSVESAFGSRILVGGFLLNNQLTDFSLAPVPPGALAVNRLAPGKRPLSSMAPTVVFDAQGKLWAVLGSPGGTRIINYVAQTLVALIDAQQAPDAVLAAPHVGSRNGPTEIESGPAAAALGDALQARGHAVRYDSMTSGTHLIVRNRQGDAWLGAADPRREGVAVGE